MRSQILGTSYLSTYLGQNIQGRLLKAPPRCAKLGWWLDCSTLNLGNRLDASFGRRELKNSSLVKIFIFNVFTSTSTTLL